MDWSNSDPLDYEVKVEANQTACSNLKQFDLQDSVMLSVCHRDREISIDRWWWRRGGGVVVVVWWWWWLCGVVVVCGLVVV